MWSWGFNVQIHTSQFQSRIVVLLPNNSELGSVVPFKQVCFHQIWSYCPSRSLSFIAGLRRMSTGSEFDGSVHPIHESCTTQVQKLVNLESRFRFWQEKWAPQHLHLHSLLLTAVHVFYIFSCFLWHLYNVLAILVIFLVFCWYLFKCPLEPAVTCDKAEIGSVPKPLWHMTGTCDRNITVMLGVIVGGARSPFRVSPSIAATSLTSPLQGLKVPSLCTELAHWGSKASGKAGQLQVWIPQQ